MGWLVQAQTRTLIGIPNHGFIICFSLFIKHSLFEKLQKMILYASKITNDLHCKPAKNKKFHHHWTFAIRISVLFATRYYMLHAQIIWKPNRKSSITTSFFVKYLELCKPNLNFIIYQSYKYFNFNQYNILRKFNTGRFLSFRMFLSS